MNKALNLAVNIALLTLQKTEVSPYMKSTSQLKPQSLYILIPY